MDTRTSDPRAASQRSCSHATDRQKNSTVQCPCILSPGRNVRAVVEEGVDRDGGKVVVVMLKEGSDDDVMDTGSRWPVAV